MRKISIFEVSRVVWISWLGPFSVKLCQSHNPPVVFKHDENQTELLYFNRAIGFVTYILALQVS